YPTPLTPLSSTHTATTEISTLSLHDALPICLAHDPSVDCGHEAIALRSRQKGAGGLHTATLVAQAQQNLAPGTRRMFRCQGHGRDRKSTRLNSSHLGISYAVFCLKKKKNT